MTKLDLATRMFLHLTRANIVPRDTVLWDTSTCDVIVFENYDDYANFYREHVGKYLDPNLINKAIYIVAKKGQIVAFKGLCEHIIASADH